MAETTPQPQPQQQLEIRFRIYCGADLFQGIFPLSTTIESIKERIMSEWPQDQSVQPTSVDDIRLMHAENPLVSGRTLGEHRFLIIPGGVVTVLVIVQLPPELRRRAVGTNQDSRIGCTACCNLL
ncbi:membrane-anchored ubiquitin-fold protein 3-like [Henckelia pumila]|uniref:membrane-anchored ubiquitin-fold protein 3-like n=1 Tax=Henckelia pumila TaxID=405737 RepID=UPI003C6E656D